MNDIESSNRNAFNTGYSRREMIKNSGLSCLGAVLCLSDLEHLISKSMNARVIPGSTEQLPVVGLGTWQTFDAGGDSSKRKILREVLVEMNKLGGTVVDSSPMYGSSEKVLGDLTINETFRDDLFYATKVWTSGKEAGLTQMNASMRKMQRLTMDLMQIHNLLDWQTHVKTLKTWKEQGKIRYWGITHYTDSSHERLEQIIKSERPDFAQFNYSIRSRNAEKSLFEIAKKYGTATIINQPFESGSLFRAVKGISLPGWCNEFEIKSWGQYFLKFILSNEAVTCVIPGTSKPHHAIDNMMAGYGPIPDTQERKKMVQYLSRL